MNPPIRIIRTFYDGGKYRWLLQLRIDDEFGCWYATIGRTEKVWRRKWWEWRYGVTEW